MNKIQYNNLKDTLIRIKNIEKLDMLNIELTSKCQVKCVWCLMQTFDSIPKKDMDFDLFLSFFKLNIEYLREQNTKIIPFHRGEPLLYPYFWECCNLFKKNGISIGAISTNLSMKINIKNFINNPIGTIIVNLGGITKETHEKNMLYSDFDLVIYNLKTLWTIGLPVYVKINPTKSNLHEIDFLPDFIEKLGGKREYAKKYTTLFLHPECASEKEKKYFLEHVYDPKNKKYFRFSFNENIIKQESKNCPKNLLVDTIFMDGSFSICCHDQYQQAIIGNIFETPLKVIRSSLKYRKQYWNALRRKLPCCKYCS